MDDVWCNGNEESLVECSYTTQHNCGHSEDVGVICQGAEEDDGTPKTIEWGNFRLVLNPNSVTDWADESYTYAYRAEGRVEYFDGYEWGTVCDDIFDYNNNAAQVFCNSIGLPSSGAQVLSYYGGSYDHMGQGSIVMDDVSCNGDEWDLTACSYSSSHNCGHGEDVGVICEEGDYATTEETIEWGNFRLVVNPSNPGSYEGRAEYWNGYEWGTICDDIFDYNNNAATVFCSSLGLPSSGAEVISYYGGNTGHQGSGVIAMDDVSCIGDEADLTYCGYTTNHNCGHGEDVGVICMDSYATDEASPDWYTGYFALIVDPNWPTSYDEYGYVTEMSGRMEYYDGYSYGTVCDDYFDQDNNGAMAFCRGMGLPFDGAYYVPAWQAGSDDQTINMDDVQCEGWESDLTQCSWRSDHNCGHGEDAGVVCTGGYGYGDEEAAAADDADALYDASGYQRLVFYPGFTDMGRVEVWSDNNGWGTVCDDIFDYDDNASTVFCTALGFDYGRVVSYYGGSYNHEGSGSINMDDVSCTGSETSLFECSYSSDNNCSHGEDVGVACYFY